MMTLKYNFQEVGAALDGMAAWFCAYADMTAVFSEICSPRNCATTGYQQRVPCWSAGRVESRTSGR